MPHYAAFYLGLHCLPKYPFRNQGMQESLNPFTNLELLAGRLIQTVQNAASDQGLHCLITENSIKIWSKMKNSTQQPLKPKGLVQLIRVCKPIRLKRVKTLDVAKFGFYIFQ